MATGGFKIADAFVTIAARNSVPTSIKSVVSALDSIDDKIVQIRGNDSATQVVKRVDAETVDDKIVDITADDAASAKVQKVDSERVGDKIVQVKAQDDATPVIEKAAAKKPDAVKVPVKADDKTQEGLDSIGGKMTAWVAGLGIGGLIGSAIGDGLDKVNLTPHLQNQMGASAEVAAKAGQTAGHVFAQGFTSDKGMIVDAISSLSSEVVNWSNLTQGEQEKISGGAVKVGQTFNQDVTGVIAAASAMVTNRLAPDFNSAFDLITVGFQNVGSRGDDLLETLQEYSGYFTQLGLSGEDAMGLIIQMMKAGARDTDYASDAIKEFGIRAIDGTQQTADGFAAIGLNAKSMSEQVGRGGDSARLALGDVIKALQNIKDPVAQNIAGAALFGTQWEDTMRRVLPNLDLTKTKLEGVSGATNRLVTELTPKQEIGRAWDTLTDGVASGLTGAAKGVGDFGRQIGDVFTLKIFDPDYDNLGLRGYITAAENAKNHTGFFRDMLGMIPPEMKAWGQSALFTNDALKGTTNVVIGLSDAILGLANKDLGYRQSVARHQDGRGRAERRAEGPQAGLRGSHRRVDEPGIRATAPGPVGGGAGQGAQQGHR
jgi:phage-related minor tail protein